ncbi:MAG TPA: tetratricopeptide repeat protein [Ferrovibrio sp.]|uniref:tetratricopeptide repeat protein n=1 Tax=Ferrovibrio sp. TaxID=1917215 RepID=UPI002ED38C9B
MEGAILRFAAASRLAPTDPGLLRSLATLCLRAGRPAEAWSAAETGLRLQPADRDFTNNRLAAMAAAGFLDAALALARRWASEAPGEAQARHRLGSLLLQTGDAPAGLAELEAALALRPDWPEALIAAAEAAFRDRQVDRARAWLDKAVALDPENQTVRMARATILLSLEIWDPGLHDYEYRLRPSAAREIVRHRLTVPRWQGEDLSGRTLLVVAEQGIGDQIRFARDLAALQRLCAGLIVECTPRLAPLLKRSLPEVTVMPSVERREGHRHTFTYDWLAQLGPIDAYIEAGSILLRLWQRGILPDRSGG